MSLRPPPTPIFLLLGATFFPQGPHLPQAFTPHGRAPQRPPGHYIAFIDIEAAKLALIKGYGKDPAINIMLGQPMPKQVPTH